MSEDDVVIDLTKVKKFFSGSSTPKGTKKPNNQKNNTDDDFDMDSEDTSDKDDVVEFKASNKKSIRSDDSMDLMSFWKQSKIFMSKYGTIFLIMIPILLSILLRLTPAYLPATDDWAKNTIDSNIKNSIVGEINKQYPSLPDEKKAELVNQQFNEIIKSDQVSYEQSIKDASQFYKSQLQDENDQTYLLAIDPYYWAHYAQDIVDRGYAGDVLIDGQPWGYKSQAPLGRPVLAEFHMFFVANFYKFVRMFISNITLMGASFYIPVILATLGVIPAFFIAKKRAGNIAGLVAGLGVALHSSFLSRTAGGFSDTDSYAVVLPLYVVWFFLNAMESKELKKSMIWMTACIGSIVIFKFAWQGWWYIYDFLLAATFVYLGYLVLANIKTIKNNGIKSLFDNKRVKLSFIKSFVFLGSSVIVVSLLGGFNQIIMALYNHPKYIATLKDVATVRIWPNVLTTVAELNPSSIPQTINQIANPYQTGGLSPKFFFVLALAGILLSLCSFLKKKSSKKQKMHELIFFSASLLFYMALVSQIDNGINNMLFLFLLMLPIAIRYLMIIINNVRNVDLIYATLLIIWFVATIYGSTRGIRFVMLLVPAFSIALGTFFGIVYKLAIRLSKIHLKIDKFVTVPLLLILIYIFAFAGPWASALSVAKQEIPSMNDAWWDGLKAINLDSQENAIITSWWDFGHWFRAIAQRGVNFDGASQDTPQAHWVGLALLTDDVDESFGILRMLDCSRNEAYDYLISEGYEPLEALEIIHKILVVHDGVIAEEILVKSDLTVDQAKKLTSFTHCVPPEGYFITSEDMVGKAGVWGHFGSWDFRRSEMYKNVYQASPSVGKEILMSDYGYDDTAATTLYYEIKNADPNQWISPWPGYASGLSGCSLTENGYKCELSVQGGVIRLYFNPETSDCYIESPNGDLRPDSFSYFNSDGEFVIKEYSESKIGYSFTFVKSGDSYSTVMLHPMQVGSVFTRLFFHVDESTPFFEKFYDNRGIVGGRILMWKINWDGLANQNKEIDALNVEFDESNLSESSDVFEDDAEVDESLDLIGLSNNSEIDYSGNESSTLESESNSSDNLLNSDSLA